MKSKKFGKGPYKKIYCIAPRHPKNFWTMQYFVGIVGHKTLMTNTAFPLLMAMTPEDANVEYFFTDENCDTINYDFDCDLVALTGYTIHYDRMKDIAAKFKERNIEVAVGGPFISLNPDAMNEFADYIFVGEAENIWPQFLSDWEKGRQQSRYVETNVVDIKKNPPVDWSLTKRKDYITYAVQTRRGCQYKCDYCDVIILHGRRVRYKKVEQVIEELKQIHAQDAEEVFIIDDNFATRKSYTKELLRAIIDWNTTLKHPLSFITQNTVDIANDEELLSLMSQARVFQLYLGIETPRKQSLEDVNKHHNLIGDLAEKVQTINRYGIIPIIGLMVGFDSDDKSIFKEQFDFLMRASSPVTGISILNAPKNTPIYDRYKSENRIVEGNFTGEWLLSTNIQPKLMSHKELVLGYHELFRKVYDPENFEARFKEFFLNIQFYYNSNGLYSVKKPKLRSHIPRFFRILKHFLFVESKEMRALFIRNLRFVLSLNSKLMRLGITILFQYLHFYYFVNQEEWDEDKVLLELTQFSFETDEEPETAVLSNKK